MSARGRGEADPIADNSTSAGREAGALLAHAVFELPLVQLSEHGRVGYGQWLAEFVATFGLVCIVLGSRESHRRRLVRVRCLDHSMNFVLICAVALLASGLTFFSGFGLGTLLLPAFALFYPIEQAVALTAVVHFLNSLFKLTLVGRPTDRRTMVVFGLPAIAASFAGAWVLMRLTDIAPLASYSVLGRSAFLTPAKLIIGSLLLAFSLAELLPRFRELSFPRKYLAVGGVLSGFFGGLSGMQGAPRSAFLARAGLTKEAFIATGVVLACLIDFSRLSIYARALLDERERLDYPLLAAAVVAAFAGALFGNRYLKKMTMRGIQRLVAIMLFGVALGLMSGLL